MQEVWKDIKGFENMYQVSNLGRVKSLSRIIKHPKMKSGEYLSRERIMKTGLDRGGYLKVGLHKDGVRTMHPIHRLVAEAFLENGNNKPQINHIDGNKTNNVVWNLEFCTRKENMEHAYRLGLNAPERHWNCKGSKSVAQYDKDMKLIKIFPSISEAKRCGFSDSMIVNCCKGRHKTHKGYTWKYFEN